MSDDVETTASAATASHACTSNGWCVESPDTVAADARYMVVLSFTNTTDGDVEVLASTTDTQTHLHKVKVGHSRSLRLTLTAPPEGNRDWCVEVIGDVYDETSAFLPEDQLDTFVCVAVT